MLTKDWLRLQFIANRKRGPAFRSTLRISLKKRTLNTRLVSHFLVTIRFRVLNANSAVALKWKQHTGNKTKKPWRGHIRYCHMILLFTRISFNFGVDKIRLTGGYKFSDVNPKWSLDITVWCLRCRELADCQFST